MNMLEIDRSVEDCLSNARQYVRGDVAIAAEIRIQSAGRNKVAVVDLSQTGFRMQCMTYIPSDRIIFLTIPGFAQLEARIAWQTEWLYGCEFARPLYAAIYDHIVRAHPDITNEPTRIS